MRLEGLEDRLLLTLAVTPYDVKTPVSNLTNHLVATNSGLNVTGTNYVGVTGQSGTYTGFALSDAQNSVSFPDGVVLTNGMAVGVQGPNQNRVPGVPFGDGYQSTDLNEPGDPTLSSLINDATFDANSFSIQFTTAPGIHSVQFQLLFASEEFPAFVGAFNDAFAALLDGTQVSFDTTGKLLTVNNNFFQFNNSGQTPAQFPATQGKTPVNFNFGYDGLTPALTTSAPLDPSVSVHTLRFVIADAGDHALDSAIFLSQLTGSTQVLSAPVTTPTNPTNSFVVTTNADSGPGSLRQVIGAANAAPNPVTITFKIPGNGPQTINLASPLPAITNSVTIDGYSQPGATPGTTQVGDNAVIPVLVDGANAGPGADGLRIGAPNCVVDGLAIGGFQGNGITIDSKAKGASIVGDFIGTDVTGTKPLGNGGFGVAVEGAAGVKIGGPKPAARNLISGNSLAGIALLSGSAGETISGNYVGTSASGLNPIGNGVDGVLVSDSSGNTIGGTVAGSGNVVSGNGSLSSQGAGIRLEGTSATNNVVLGNTVGTTADGLGKLGNAVLGVLINDASSNTIGGVSTAARNVLSGNLFAGLMIAGSSSGNLVLGNSIGTDLAGTHAIGNGGVFQGSVVGDGVYIDGATGNTIGGTAAGSANVISGNALDGVLIFNSSAVGNLVQGNKIGTDIGGTAALGNGEDGLVIFDAPRNQILANVLSANGGNGITISGQQATGNHVNGNDIGLTGSLVPLANGGFGVAIVNDAMDNDLPSNAIGNNTLGPIRDTSLAAAVPVPGLAGASLHKTAKHPAKAASHNATLGKRTPQAHQFRGHSAPTHHAKR